MFINKNMQFKEFFKSDSNRYDAYVSRLVRCTPKVKLVTLCENNFPIYRATINPEKSKSIFIVGGIHGNEIGGITGIMDYLSRGKFPKDITLEFFPILNPTGFISNNRFTDDGNDLNRDMCHRIKQPEVKSILELAKKIKPSLFWTLHEDESTDGFYSYYSDEDKKSLWDKCVREASSYFPILDGEIHGDKCINGLISHPNKKRIESEPKHKCSIENGIHDMGFPYLTTETPMKNDLTERTLFNRKLIDIITQSY